MSQSSSVRKAAPDHLDRRHLLRSLGAGLAALAVPGSLAAAGEASGPTDPCNPTGLPYHLSVLDPAYPNALVPHARKLAVLATQGKKERVMGAIDDLVKKNKAFFQKTDFVKNLSKLVKSGKTPKTIQEMLSLLAVGWVTPELCEPENGSCKDFGCADDCRLRGHSGGGCLPLGLPEEPCSCLCIPGVLEFSLIALILLLLMMTPGPDEIPAILAAVSRLIIRRAPGSHIFCVLVQLFLFAQAADDLGGGAH